MTVSEAANKKLDKKMSYNISNRTVEMETRFNINHSLSGAKFLTSVPSWKSNLL